MEERRMKLQRLLIALTVVNLASLLATLAYIHPVAAQATPAVLRGRALEIVDAQGRVRASLNVLPATTQPSGQTYPETVLLRLITEQGRPSVKISTSEAAAGVSLAGPSGTSNTYVIVEARGSTSALTLKNEDGRVQVVKP
jgi:hypothetical protein